MAGMLRYIKNPYRIIASDKLGSMRRFIPDELYLKCKYKQVTGLDLNLSNPQTFNEKIQWLKLNDRRPAYTEMVDKYEAKRYVAGIIGEQYIIPTLGVWDRFEDIDFDKLPDKFVLKCTHDSGGVCVCKNKANLDRDKARRTIEKSLKTNYFWVGREWPYKNVKPRIIAEQYIESIDNDLMDYKFMCFDGEVKAILLCSGRFSKEGVKMTFFDPDWKRLPYKRPKHPVESR